jgi:hypothetical protein
MWEYGTPKSASPKTGVVTSGGGGLIVIVREPTPVPPGFVANIETNVDPKTVGIPEITPVAVFRESPVGKAVDE